ncbi:hypothetical protein ACWGI8_43530, partial [Streptomyces sp. NPDC054841]
RLHPDDDPRNLVSLIRRVRPQGVGELAIAVLSDEADDLSAAAGDGPRILELADDETVDMEGVQFDDEAQSAPTGQQDEGNGRPPNELPGDRSWRTLKAWAAKLALELRSTVHVLSEDVGHRDGTVRTIRSLMPQNQPHQLLDLLRPHAAQPPAGQTGPFWTTVSAPGNPARFTKIGALLWDPFQYTVVRADRALFSATGDVELAARLFEAAQALGGAAVMHLPADPDGKIGLFTPDGLSALPELALPLPPVETRQLPRSIKTTDHVVARLWQSWLASKSEALKLFDAFDELAEEHLAAIKEISARAEQAVKDADGLRPEQRTTAAMARLADRARMLQATAEALKAHAEQLTVSATEMARLGQRVHSHAERTVESGTPSDRALASRARDEAKKLHEALNGAAASATKAVEAFRDTAVRAERAWRLATVAKHVLPLWEPAPGAPVLFHPEMSPSGEVLRTLQEELTVLGRLLDIVVHLQPESAPAQLHISPATGTATLALRGDLGDEWQSLRETPAPEPFLTAPNGTLRPVGTVVTHMISGVVHGDGTSSEGLVAASAGSRHADEASLDAFRDLLKELSRAHGLFDASSYVLLPVVHGRIALAYRTGPDEGAPGRMVVRPAGAARVATWLLSTVKWDSKSIYMLTPQVTDPADYAAFVRDVHELANILNLPIGDPPFG